MKVAAKKQSSREQVRVGQVAVKEVNGSRNENDFGYESLGYGGWANLYVVTD